jgi:tetratricopeptide (TPR) repeat protein
VILLAVGAVLVFALNKLFPTDPKVSAATGKQMAGQEMVQSGGDLQKALANFQEAAALTPDDPEPWLWVGVTREKLGQPAEARAAYDKAHSLVKEEMSFYLARAPIYLSFRMYERGQADLDAVYAQDPDNPQAHYYQAGMYEDQGDLERAAQELEKVSTLADQRQQTELTAIARYRLGMLMQAMQVRPPATWTPTPTAAPGG